MSEENKYYQSIYEIPLFKFEECLLTNNLSALIIAGFPDPVNLAKAWNNILEEYSEALGNAEYQLYLNLYKEVEISRMKFQMVTILIAALRKNDSPYFCSELNFFLRTDFKFPINDLPAYFEELDKCERRAKGLKLQLDLKEIEFEAVKKKVNGTGVEELNRNYFTSVLIILSKHNGYEIKNDIPVSKYCVYLQKFNEYCEQMSKEAVKK